MRQTEKIFWDTETIKKFDISGPRYTSYPTALKFHEEFGQKDYLAAVRRSNDNNRPLSLYFHLPFCNTVCYYCACNKVVTANKARAREYLDHLITEIQLQSELFSPNRPVIQLHWGGGTPTFFSHSEMTELMHQTGRHFHLLGKDEGEYSIELDPRTADIDTLSLLRGLGFNRISLGIQDFNEEVQRSVNRFQPYKTVRDAFNNARDLAFNSISIDLIYGLPHQTLQSFEDTMGKVTELNPDRISLFNYAHLPTRFKTQKQIQEEALPSPSTKLAIMCQASNTLIKKGYQYIGMDHFAKYDDDLSVAQRENTLQRNFQGYSTGRQADLVGLGVSSISRIDNTYSQNIKSVSGYQDALKNNHLPIERGYILTKEDEIRRQVIMDLICHNHLNKKAVEQTWGIKFDQHFAAELDELTQFCADGLLMQNDEEIRITETGRLLVRRICMTFDQYSLHVSHGQQFSRII